MSEATWLDLEGATLAAEHEHRKGADGLPLVFLHAGVADGRMWQPQWDAFVEQHPLLRYDRRGFGRTRVHEARPYSRTFDLMAVLDAAGLQRSVLVGCSQGGRVALDLAIARPDRVAALVLVAPAVNGAPVPELQGELKALDEAIDAAVEAGNLEAANQLEAQMWLDGPAAPRGRVTGAARELFLDMNGIALAAADPGTAVDEPSAWVRLEQIGRPTLVIWGDLDVPYLQERCETLVQRIPGAQRVVLEGTAHLPGLEAPTRFNAALADFLATL